MKVVKLLWYERMYLWHRLGMVQAPTIKDAAVYLRIIDKIRPSDQETIDTKLATDGRGGYRWEPGPSIGYGDREVELENEEAAALTKGIDTHPQPVLVADAAWLLRLLGQLVIEEDPPKEIAA